MARPKSDVNRAELILGAADELFARYGYERTSIDDIARHANIGKGSIYLEFSTKEKILLSLLAKHAEILHATFEEKVRNQTTSMLDLLRSAFVEESINCYDRVTRGIHTPEALLHTSAAIKSHFADFFVSRRKLLHSLLLKAASAEEIKQEKATEDVALALMMATSCLFPPYFDNYSETVTIKSREDLIFRAPIIVDLIIAGLKS